MKIQYDFMKVNTSVSPLQVVFFKKNAHQSILQDNLIITHPGLFINLRKKMKNEPNESTDFSRLIPK